MPKPGAPPRPPSAADPARPERAVDLRVWAHRKLRRHRLRDLAAEAGCSRSLLSRVENGLSMPLLGTPYRLSKALGIAVSALLKPVPGQMLTIYAPQERPHTSISGAAEGGESSAESLVPFAEDRRLEALIVSLPADVARCGPFVHEGGEVGLVLERGLELTVDDISYLMQAQSSFYLQSDRPRGYWADGDVSCWVVWINTHPTF